MGVDGGIGVNMRMWVYWYKGVDGDMGVSMRVWVRVWVLGQKGSW